MAFYFLFFLKRIEIVDSLTVPWIEIPYKKLGSGLSDFKWMNCRQVVTKMLRGSIHKNWKRRSGDHAARY
jgi:hypothetical protein